MEEPSLTPTERLILKNQYAILEFLTLAFPNIARRGNMVFHDATAYMWLQDVMENGSPTLIREVMGRIEDPHMTSEEESEILEVLALYDDLQQSFELLEDKEGLTKEQVAFDGWEGNSRSGELFFAKLYCYRNESRYGLADTSPTHFAAVHPSPARNGHSPNMDMYRRMLDVHQQIKERRDGGYQLLTASEIREILAARYRH